MLIIFSVNDQKITHDLKGQLVAGSVDIVQAAFKFDSSWDELDKIVVFTSSACPKPVPVQFADEAFYIPVLHPEGCAEARQALRFRGRFRAGWSEENYAEVGHHAGYHRSELRRWRRL